VRGVRRAATRASPRRSPVKGSSASCSRTARSSSRDDIMPRARCGQVRRVTPAWPRRQSQ
jgi:hypothetical protein